MKKYQTLLKLSNAFGVSGKEIEVRSIIMNEQFVFVLKITNSNYIMNYLVEANHSYIVIIVCTNRLFYIHYGMIEPMTK